MIFVAAIIVNKNNYYTSLYLFFPFFPLFSASTIYTYFKNQYFVMSIPLAIVYAFFSCSVKLSVYVYVSAKSPRLPIDSEDSFRQHNKQ